MRSRPVGLMGRMPSPGVRRRDATEVPQRGGAAQERWRLLPAHERGAALPKASVQRFVFVVFASQSGISVNLKTRGA